MFVVMQKYIKNKNKNGLLLINTPTGFGKSYEAIRLIYEECLKEENLDRKFIFVTPLKKNLSLGDIKKRFIAGGHGDLFKEKVLFLNSNMESVIEGWSSELDKNVPPEIKKTEEYKEFKANIVFIKQQRDEKNKNYMSREFLTSIETNLREKSEPKLRAMISKMIRKEFKTVEKRILAVKTDSKWKWIGTLYPAVFTRERQVLFMSMDKLLSKNTTIVESPYLFYNSDIINNAVIFIDEFDSTKTTVLSNIINNGLRDRVDYIELFKDIYSSLHMDDYPKILTTPSKERMEGDYRNQSLESIIDGIRKKAEYIYSNYNFHYKHRTSVDLEDDINNYLFQDHQFHAILNAKKSYITMFSDEEKRINTIGFSTKKTSDNSIHTMLGQLRGYITYFQIAVKILAINYMQQKNENRLNGTDAFSLEEAIRSVLDLFRLSEDNIDYLTSQIMMSARKSTSVLESSKHDLSFYENGFRYYAFENDKQHDMQSQIMMFSFQTTPEKILLRFCEKAKVIGMSATATIPSVIGNYDIDYLKNKLAKTFIELTDEEKRRIEETFNNQQEGYARIKIHTEILGCGNEYSSKSWASVFKNDEISDMIYRDIQCQIIDEDKKDFNKKRYLRVAQAFKEFVTHEDIYSFLCVLNKHPKTNDPKLDRKVLFKIFDLIAEENGWKNYSNSQTIFFLDGDEYDEKKNDLIERLSKGEKLFVISVYQTIGAGQNIQYPIPQNIRDNIVKINKKVLKDEKDFDAIYLDNPTHLVVPLFEKMDDENFVKCIYQMEFLQEVGEISSQEAIQNIKKAFKNLMVGPKNQESFNVVNKKKSVALLCTRYIIQAIGRICRTNQKNKNIYIYADENLIENIDVSVTDEGIFNPEFTTFIEKIREMGGEKPEENMIFENQASLNSVKGNKRISNMLNNDWTEAKMNDWKELRSRSLMYPTFSQENFSNNSAYRYYYIKQPEASNHYYYYSQEEDYNNISISFSKKEEYPFMVSAEGSKLYDLFLIPGVKELFEQNGWATSFEPNIYIMSPPMWNNIYKGALGEVVGKYLLEKYLHIELKEIDDLNLFELFDYEISGSSIYVDFKNWQEGVTVDKDKVIRKIAKKAKDCKCKCVVVANIIAEGKWNISEVDIDGIHIVSLPCLILKINGKAYFEKEAWAVLQRCIDEYKYKD